MDSVELMLLEEGHQTKCDYCTTQFLISFPGLMMLLLFAALCVGGYYIFK
jgi:hypothetical protein